MAQNDTPMSDGGLSVAQSILEPASVDAATNGASDPHSLSTFFIIGIAINVIVILAFAVWFAKEWGKKKNIGDDE